MFSAGLWHTGAPESFRFGLGVPAGLFVPSLLSGAVIGRFVGETLHVLHAYVPWSQTLFLLRLSIQYIFVHPRVELAVTSSCFFSVSFKYLYSTVFQSCWGIMCHMGEHRCFRRPPLRRWPPPLPRQLQSLPNPQFHGVTGGRMAEIG